MTDPDTVYIMAAIIYSQRNSGSPDPQKMIKAYTEAQQLAGIIEQQRLIPPPTGATNDTQKQA